MIRVLAGTIARQVPEVLAAHLELMRSQDATDVQLDLVYLDDSEETHKDANAELFRSASARVIPAGARGDADGYAVCEDTHRWSVPAFHRLAREKQRLLELAVEERYDYIWLVDSDLLCGPATLRCLLEDGRDVVSGVFWTRWTTGDDPLPQVWQRHPYGFDAAGWSGESFMRALKSRELVRVRGLGACTLIRVEALQRGLGFWPLVEGLPGDGMWQGEDRHFCVRAERLHTPLYADAWPEIWHAYRPSDRARIRDVRELLLRQRPKRRNDGVWVRFAVEPLEEPTLIGYVEQVRGKLGLLELAPEVEHEVRRLPLGDAAIVRARIHGQTRTLRVRMLDYRDGRALPG